MKTIIVILAGSGVLSGCVSSQEQIDSHAPALNSWVGSPIEEFLDMHGTPTTTIDMIDYDLYGYIFRKRVTNSTDTQSCTTTLDWNPDSLRRPVAKSVCTTLRDPTSTITYACTYGLAVVGNVIRDWKMWGDNCRMVTVSYRDSRAGDLR